MAKNLTLTFTEDEAEMLVDALEADMEGYIEAAKEARGNGNKADLVTFTSASTVRNLLAALGGSSGLSGRRLASIGPITSSELAANGLTPDIEATQHDVEGLVSAIRLDATGS